MGVKVSYLFLNCITLAIMQKTFFYLLQDAFLGWLLT